MSREAIVENEAKSPASVLPVCNKCKHHIEGVKCAAFEVIPDKILFGEDNHSTVLPEQSNLLVFEPK